MGAIGGAAAPALSNDGFAPTSDEGRHGAAGRGQAESASPKPKATGKNRETVKERPLAVDDRPPPPAEQLLEALRRRRPLHIVVQPRSAEDGDTDRETPMLWPQGAAVVDQVGHLVRDGRWWTLVSDSPDSLPPVKLLPNAQLEVLGRTVRASQLPLRFIIAGEMTVFDDENYLLIRFARRARGDQSTKDPAAGQFAATGDGAGPAPAAASGDVGQGLSPASGRQGPAGETTRSGNTSDSAAVATGGLPVEQVLAALRGSEPDRPVRAATSEPAPLPDGTTPSAASPTGRHRERRREREVAAVVARRPEGSTVAQRPGRLLRDHDWWTFVFESDQADYPQPPMKLLPNMSLQRMIEASRHATAGLVFLVTGDVTLYEGENYLLPRVAIRRIDSGNLTK